MKKHYRIVTDEACGFEVQRRFLGIWYQVDRQDRGRGVNSHNTIALAEAFIEDKCSTSHRFKARVVKRLTCP